MSKQKITIVGGLAVSAALLLGGCAPNTMMMEEQQMMMQSEIDAAMRKANSADYNAGIAKSMADEALTKINMMEAGMMKRGMKHRMMK